MLAESSDQLMDAAGALELAESSDQLVLDTAALVLAAVRAAARDKAVAELARSNLAALRQRLQFGRRKSSTPFGSRVPNLV